MSNTLLQTLDFEFTIDGTEVTVRAKIFADEDSREPWKEACGNGEVSDWERRNKLPGEWVINSDGGMKRFYDYAGTIKVAQRDRWDAEPYLGDQVVIRMDTSPNSPHRPYPLFWAGGSVWERDRAKAKPMTKEQAEHSVAAFNAEYVDIPLLRLVPAETRKMRAAKAVQSNFDYLKAWCDDQWQFVGIVVVVLDPDGEESSVEDSLWGVESYRDHHERQAQEMAEDLAKGLGTEWGPTTTVTYTRL